MKTQKLLFISVILIFCAFNAFSQANHGSNISNSGTAHAEPIGWVSGGGSVANDLDIDNNFSSQSINFSTYNGGLLKRMTILSNGNVGVGNFTPNFLFDVDNGDININNYRNGYRIGTGSLGSDYVLWHAGNTTNIFVGVKAGTNSLLNYWNTFVGNYAGSSVVSVTSQNDGNGNTFTGYSAGRNNTNGDDNSFYGDSAGFSTTTGHHNTLVGAHSGEGNTTGRSNTIIGFEAGMVAATNEFNTITGRAAGKAAVGGDNCYYGKDAGQGIVGINNCYYGSHAGDDVIAGENNTAYGWQAGRALTGGTLNCFYGISSGYGLTLGGNGWTGDGNCFYGYNTGAGTNAPSIINNSGIFGPQAYVNSSNKIIIGNNEDSTGFGLSDDTYFLGPRSRVEINADGNTTDITGTAGSGLQFRQLFKGCSINSNTSESAWGKVLTVDPDGIVKLTDDLGNLYTSCAAGGIQTLTDDYGLDLSSYRIYNDGQANSGNPYDAQAAIGIGYACGTTLPGKLSVEEYLPSTPVGQSTVAGYFHNGDWNENCIQYDYIKQAVWGVTDGYSFAEDDCRSTIESIGGEFAARNNMRTNIAVRGISGDGNNYLGSTNIGGYFESQYSSNWNAGVFAVTGNVGVSNYGIYAMAPTGTCPFGPIAGCFQAAGLFNGDVFGINGYIISDAQVKSNVQQLQNPISIINALHPKTYEFRTAQFPNLSLPTNQQSGLIAQEVQQVLPELVKPFRLPPAPDSTGAIDTTGANATFLAVNYTGLIPYLIGAVQQQQTTLDSLQQKLQDLQNQINNCCSAQGSAGSTHRLAEKVELKDVITIVLNQNTPNPFSEETYIDYEIPSTVKKAIIVIYDKLGNVLKSIPISDRGASSLHIYAENLSSGTYAYSLVCDGITIDTKQMVCQK